MRPWLRDGRDEVVLYPCRTENLRRWEIVLFRYRDRHILHRIIKKEEGRFVLQGDAVCTFQEECGAEDIIGVVKQVCYPSGKIVSTLSFYWRMRSRLWRMVGPYRGIVLRLWSVLGGC